jgi:threonine dehydratase
VNQRLSVDRITEAARFIDPVFRHTPQYECEPLGDELDVRFSLKVETLNPVRCFKGRGADWLVAAADDTPLACASAGNFGQAMAYACRKRDRRLTVYAATAANPFKVERMRALGAEVVLHGDDFDAAKMEARRVATDTGARFVEDGLDVETLEGAGTIGLEWLTQPDMPDTLLVPLGNGSLIVGVARAVKEVRPDTRVVAVQAAGAPAMVESWRAGNVVIRDRIDTIADGIGVRVPIPETVADLQLLIDDAVLVQEASILSAMRLLHRHAGLVAEPSGAVGVAAVLEQPQLFRGRHVGTVICGSNLTPDQMQHWLY